MKVIVADKAGICFGVKRALDLVNAAAGDGGEIATLGPLIHNPQVVERLKEQGVGMVSDVCDVESGAIVMPSHGVPRDVIETAQRAGLKIIDATCPFVATVHTKVESLSSAGYFVVIVGDEGHSEVKAIKSAAGENSVVISSVDEVDGYDWASKKVGVVCQTTQTPERFGEIVGKIAAKAREVLAYNTICYATYDRQEAASKLAVEVQAMIVVGGRNSANTNRLTEICSQTGIPTYHIETADELQDEWVKGLDIVGLTAGASTPGWIIVKVKERLEQI